MTVLQDAHPGAGPAPHANTDPNAPTDASQDAHPDAGQNARGDVRAEARDGAGQNTRADAGQNAQGGAGQNARNGVRTDAHASAGQNTRADAGQNARGGVRAGARGGVGRGGRGGVGVPLAPLVGLIGRTDRRWGGLGVLPGLLLDPAEATGWLRPHRLAGPLLRELVGRSAARYGAAEHVGAAFLWKSYAYWTMLPVALGWAINRRVPVGQLVVRALDARPYLSVAYTDPAVAVLADDACAGEPGTIVVPDEAALAAEVRRALLDAYHAPLITALHELSRVGERTFWGSVAEAVAHPVLEVVPERISDAGRLLDLLGLADLIDITAVGDAPCLQRRTCCLAITVSGLGRCATCCIPEPK